MKRNHIALLLGATLIVMIMGSCDALFTNQFKAAGFGQLTADKIANAPAADLIDQSGILTGQLADSFFEMLADDPALTQETIDKLEAVFNDPDAQPALAQAAVVLAIEINLKGVGADEVIANAPSAIALLTDANFDIKNPDDLKKFLDLLLPPDIAEKAIFTDDQLNKIKSIIDTLDGADLSTYFNVLAASVGSTNGYEAEGLDAGTLAQIALIVRVLENVAPVTPYTTLGAAVSDLLKHIEDSDFNPDIYIDYSALDFEAILKDPGLEPLLSAAGFNVQTIIDQFSK